jgi:hypothetical protein
MNLALFIVFIVFKGFTGRYDESTRVKHDDKWNRNVYIDTPTPDVAEE